MYIPVIDYNTSIAAWKQVQGPVIDYNMFMAAW